MVGERRRVRISPLVHPGGALTRPARAFESAERLSAPNPGVATETAMRCLGFESARQFVDFQEVPRFPRDTRGGRKAQTVNEKRPLYEAFLRTPRSGLEPATRRLTPAAPELRLDLASGVQVLRYDALLATIHRPDDLGRGAAAVMTLAFYQLLALLAGTSRSDLRRQVQYLKAENEVLRSKLGTRVSVTPAERARLARLAKAVGPAIKSLVSIVSPGTVLRWINRPGRRARFNRPASSRPPVRPRTPAEIRAVILRMARETGWGYTRILGEIRKLGLLVSRSTVVNILREAGVPPVPSRGEPRWNDFVRTHARTLWACDFVARRPFPQARPHDPHPGRLADRTGAAQQPVRARAAAGGGVAVPDQRGADRLNLECSASRPAYSPRSAALTAARYSSRTALAEPIVASGHSIGSAS